MTRIFLVHALRIDTEEVAQRRDVALLGRPVDAVVVASGLPGFHARRFREAPEAEGKKSVKKIRQKNDIQKKTKNWRTLAFGPKFWPFSLANCERSIQIQ